MLSAPGSHIRTGEVGEELRGNSHSVAVAVRIKSEGRTRGMGATAVTLGLRALAGVVGCPWSEWGGSWAA